MLNADIKKAQHNLKEDKTVSDLKPGNEEVNGKNIDNPVLLYLHGGPGSATSDIDYAFTRKWADVYTVVIWDQRNCGKSYDTEQNDIVLTRKLFMEQT